MREDAFRAFLASRIGSRAVGSYLSNARLAERQLDIDLDHVDWADMAIPGSLGDRLRHKGIPETRSRDTVSALRQYARFVAGTTAPPVPAAIGNPPTVLLPRALVSEAETPDLFLLHAEIEHELRSRHILRTGNNPTGDYAERLFSAAFGWHLEPNSACGHDATDTAGNRYQIKGRRIGNSGGRQLGSIRRLPDRSFDYLAAVLFHKSYAVSRAVLMPWSLVMDRARRSNHVNGWTLMISDRLMVSDGVTDVTVALQTIQRNDGAV